MTKDLGEVPVVDGVARIEFGDIAEASRNRESISFTVPESAVPTYTIASGD